MSAVDLRGRLRRLAAIAVVITALTGGACASRGSVPRPFPGAATPPDARSAPETGARPLSSASASDVVATALALRGAQYRNGGSEPTRGFDCSGLVQWVFAQHGTALPRETREQFDVGKTIDDDEVQPGDLVFFETVSKGPSHVGIALGNGDFVHAPSSRGVVRIESYSRSEYWARRWVGAKRIVAKTASARGLTPPALRAEGLAR